MSTIYIFGAFVCFPSSIFRKKSSYLIRLRNQKQKVNVIETFNIYLRQQASSGPRHAVNVSPGRDKMIEENLSGCLGNP